MTSEPLRWLGAPSPRGLALPDAHPSASHVYAPRGVWLDQRRLIVVDSGNHRVLIWHERPSADHASADVVLCQSAFDREGPQAGGRGPANGLHLPTGITVVDGRLFIADAWHHRVLVWDTIPESNDTPPDWVLGQPDRTSVGPNAGGEISAASFYWPYGIGMVDGHFVVTDTGNRRVLAWRGVPAPGQPADLVLGQDASTLGLENRGGAVSARSFRWPHAVGGDASGFFVADAGNHRVLAWPSVPSADGEAAAVFGQVDFASNVEFPYRLQTARMLRFPYALACDAERLAVADTANNRVLIVPRAAGGGLAGDAIEALGQPDLTSNGENRWTKVTHETLCWPYGLALFGDTLAIADSGNNRVMLWRVPSMSGAGSTETRSRTACV